MSTPRPEHRVRRWAQKDAVRSVTTGKVMQRMAYHWEGWGKDCVKEGKPTSGASLFKSKADDQAAAHKAGKGEDLLNPDPPPGPLKY